MIEPGLEPLGERRCPDCGADQFRRGPAGGASVNIECAGCGARFNVCSYAGQLILAQRIAHNGDWPERGLWQ